MSHVLKSLTLTKRKFNYNSYFFKREWKTEKYMKKNEDFGKEIRKYKKEWKIYIDI